MAAPDFEVYERAIRFREERYEDITPGESNWLVKGVLPAVGLAYIAGPSRSGKSFVALDWCLRIATGQKVMDRRTSQGAVAYFAAEDAWGIRLRTEAWRRDFKRDTAAFSLFGQTPHLEDAEAYDDLEATVRDVAEARLEAGDPLRVIVFDTLSQSAPGIEENGSKDLGPILIRLAELSAALKCLVIVVAHTGKDAERGIRGWSGQLGNSDAVIMVDRQDRDGVSERTLLLDKVKNGPDGAKWSFSLRTIDLGTDADGDAVTSCVPEYEGAAVVKKPRTAGQSGRDKLVLRAIRLCEDAGLTVPVPLIEGVPPGTLGVMRERLKDRLGAEGYWGEDDNPDAAKRQINRDLRRLVEQEIIRANAEMVWFRTDR